MAMEIQKIRHHEPGRRCTLHRARTYLLDMEDMLGGYQAILPDATITHFHLSPGRFFASMEVKLILAHLIFGYEIKWTDDVYSGPNAHGIAGGEEGGYRPPDIWFAGSLSPNRDAKILIRKRTDL